MLHTFRKLPYFMAFEQNLIKTTLFTGSDWLLSIVIKTVEELMQIPIFVILLFLAVQWGTLALLIFTFIYEKMLGC